MNHQPEASASHFNEEEVNLSPTQLLKLAESHLRVRNFSRCRHFVLQYQQRNDPNYAFNNSHAFQLLTMANILSNPTNYYSILQVTPFCNDFTLIRSQFKHILSIIDPIKDKSSVGNEAANLVWKAYGCLSDPTKKTQFDSQFVGQRSENENENESESFEDVGTTFWTFCPYCFYMYQFYRVYEGCCLRCQNQTCRRAFHGVAVNSLPKMEMGKGVNFGCFGYFPLGFPPESGKKFESWSPIVGMSPVRRIGKTRAGRMNLNDEHADYGGGFDYNNSDFIESLDESDDESGNDHGVNVGGANVGNARMRKRKSVAWNARTLMSRGRKSNDGVGVNGSRGYREEDEDGNGGVVDGSCFEADDMAFFEENGEIFVGLGPDGAI